MFVNITNKIGSKIAPFAMAASLVMGAGAIMSSGLAFAQNSGKGSATNLPLPRFVSLKSKPVNLRVGPGRDYPVAWTFLKAGVPLEVIQEFEHWRRVRDSEGAEGWVFHSLLSSTRSAITAPWDKGKTKSLVNAYKTPEKKTALAAKIQAGALVTIQNCEKNWCYVIAGDDKQSIEAYVEQDYLWGVYPGEDVE